MSRSRDLRFVDRLAPGLALIVAAIVGGLLPGAASAADTARCGTEVTAEHLAHLRARAELPAARPPEEPEPPYCVPIAAHIVRRSNGTSGLSMTRYDQGMEDLNAAYANTGVGFYTLSIDYIDDDDYYEEIDTDAEIDAIRGENVVANAINAYFVKELADEDGGLCGKSSFTGTTPQGIVMDNDCMGLTSNPSTWPHEVGHYFDLYHTHETTFGAELVDGTNCTTAGDLLCGTPADPTLDTSDDNANVNDFPDCSYFGTETDANGDSYAPDTSQYMSYAPKRCRDTFSGDSETRFLTTLLDERPDLLERGCPPEPGCLDPTVCTDPGVCNAEVECDGGVATCSDPDGDDLAPSCDPASPYPLGVNGVDATCDDGVLQTTSACEVVVEDCEDPTCSAPSPTELECNELGGVSATDPAVVAWLGSATAGDNCAVSSLVDDAPAFFDAGCAPGNVTPVEWTATDTSWNQETCDSSLTVVDTTPPDVTPESEIAYCLWPPNHRYVCFDRDDFDPEISDVCTEAITWNFVGCGSDQADDANGDGSTSGDCVVDPGGAWFCVRSERAGPESANRRYTVQIEASDDCGNTSPSTVIAQVSVPHDRRGGGSCINAAMQGCSEGVPLPCN